MRKIFAKNDGFTLVELLISTVIGALVMGAAVTVLMLGMRIQNTSNAAAQSQFTTRIVLELMEKLASEGDISKVESTAAGWEIKGKDGENQKTILSYDGRVIKTGDTVVLDGVYASYITFKGSLLTVSIETAEGNYNSSVYCRTTTKPTFDFASENEIPKVIAKILKAYQDDTDNNDTKTNFLAALVSQYPTDGTLNRGTIIENGSDDNGRRYAQWYNDEWPADTPWCACFISYGLSKSRLTAPTNHNKWFGYVDESENSYWTYFENDKRLTKGTTGIQAGDLLFFDYDLDGNPEHIGAVLEVKTEGNKIYTIEGNSAGLVAVRSYDAGDSRLIAYGRLFDSLTQ